MTFVSVDEVLQKASMSSDQRQRSSQFLPSLFPWGLFQLSVATLKLSQKLAA